MLLLYLVTIILLIWLGVTQQQSERDRREFEQATIVNCEANQKNTVNFNAFIDTLISQIKKDPDRSAARKREAELFYSRAIQTVPQCPPGDPLR